MASENQPESGNNTCDLGTPLHFHFSGRSAKNRFMKVSLTERAATWSPVDKTDNGIPGDELFNLYRSWGLGGYGVVLTGNVMIDRDNLESPGNMIIPIDAQLSGQRLEAFKRLAAEAKTDGSLFIAQVSHPGRQVVSTLQPDPVSASDVQLTTQLFGAGFSKPHPASLEEIRAIKAGFVHAAVFLEKAGFDGIQLHGAHGYLLAQFLSETTNLRTDQYGGSIENRARLITEIADEIRKQTRPDFVLGIKINSVEFQAKGFTVEEAAELCELLEKHQFDFVELSGGTYEEMGWVYRKESTRAREAFFLEFAEMITPRLQHTKTYVTGGLRSARAMVDASKTVDGIGLGRPTSWN
ncbi:hypothetical protein QBC38DRAFT_483546 [Podospora fimiseda]|uniref:NADH:flavin oxidoreductase/NADH oxidase N-terminal domain-containing protein n=1 Tax=Podospora fimiseda TaxID=252190 RepID=A0AAN7GUM7_9PEZI|nr:hypothetical protein QBC38DRAFT_483546 [Podospora fimiseda]